MVGGKEKESFKPATNSKRKKVAKEEPLEADVTWHSHAYAICPYCGEESELEHEGTDIETCTFCWRTFKYTTEQ